MTSVTSPLLPPFLPPSPLHLPSPPAEEPVEDDAPAFLRNETPVKSAPQKDHVEDDYADDTEPVDEAPPPKKEPAFLTE